MAIPTEPAKSVLGDIFIDTTSDNTLVWSSNGNWSILNGEHNTICQSRKTFEQARRQQFKEHPELAKAWKEYKLLEKLTLSDGL